VNKKGDFLSFLGLKMDVCIEKHFQIGLFAVLCSTLSELTFRRLRGVQFQLSQPNPRRQPPPPPRFLIFRLPLIQITSVSSAVIGFHPASEYGCGGFS
jgi:hypothetical protein